MTTPDRETPLERRILEEWPEHRAGDDFADRVMARLPAPPAAAAPRRRAAVWFAAGLAAGVALTWWLGRSTPDGPLELGPAPQREARVGELVATERATRTLGVATVVAEAGAVLRWRHDDARTVIEHVGGAAFYRVDAGGPADTLVVELVMGRVTAAGSCFAIEAGTTRTELRVFEGSVRVGAHDGTSVVVSAGHSVGLTRRGIGTPRPRGARDQRWSRRAVPGLAAPPRPTAPTCAEEPPAFEPGPDILRAWAEECRLNFDVAPLGYDAGMLAWFLDRLELTGSERQEVAQAVRDTETGANHDLVQLFVDATGDEALAGRASLDWMFDEVLRSADVDEPAHVRRKLARERAGLEVPPEDLQRVTPYEELVRRLADTADELQQAVAARLGEPRAHALRARHGGWPGLRWDVAGCAPEPGP